MKILLMASPVRKSDMPVLPPGVCYIAADLTTHGHEVDLCDPNVSTRDFLSEFREKFDASPHFSPAFYCGGGSGHV